MTTVLLVRHGQARFGTDNYDRLSTLGVEQARLTGRHLAREGRTVEAAVSGTLVRQRDTARHALTEWAPSLTAVQDERFDEYNAGALFASYLPVAMAREPALGRPWADLRHDRRLYQQALAAVTALWVAGADGHDGETWQAFRHRVRAALEDAMAGRGYTDTIAVFTSGGVIGAAVAAALGLDGDGAMAVSRRTLNAGITELHYGRSGFSLVGFNSVAHLRLAGGETMLTHR